MMAKFIWDNKEGSGIIWHSWARMARPKSHRGLGFQSIHDFNVAMLSKQSWHLLMYPNSFSTRLLKARNFKDSSILKAKLGENLTYTWGSIVVGIALLRKGCMRQVGDGMDTSV